MNFQIKSFFDDSESIRDLVLQPLEHIRSNWDLYWNDSELRYVEEEHSFGSELNQLILEIATIQAPENYHQHEDKVAHIYQESSDIHIQKNGRFWGGEDYRSILEQGGFDDVEEKDLVLSAAGRIKAALGREQYHIDNMEKGHQIVLCMILSNILYHRMYSAQA
ncbi:hypothetical protein [Vibrio sp. ED002]|uniref:hypothetical protein n=1 Tax=Vibrio sp. ED002 TaxID=2785123 RepID=UPI002010BC2D|nr:hypothetical protein [Vibrio sp. ED002]UQA50978.1 hypothetical protein ITG12_01145 [Vibrio sp. ED002]